MENQIEARILVLSSKIGIDMMNNLKNQSNITFDIAYNTNDCLIKLQADEYDALLIDTVHLMSNNAVNTYYIRTINELVPVIAIAEGDKPEIENAIRAEKIFYYLVSPVCGPEVTQTITEAAKWVKLAP